MREPKNEPDSLSTPVPPVKPVSPAATVPPVPQHATAPRHDRSSSGLVVSQARVGRILTRASGFLATVTSHSLQPYRGCTFGRSLCGVGCYVQASPWVTRGAAWGSFLEVRENAAEAYRAEWAREREWARGARGRFSVFLSSATDPFVPQERRYLVTRRVLSAMVEQPPDLLILQTHSDRVADEQELLAALAERCTLRVHISIESDRERFPGLPPPACSVAARFEAAARLRAAGLRVVITVSPLLPIADPRGFFRRVADVADAVVIDHFIGGDGTKDGSRTRRTRLPEAMALIDPTSVELDYRDRMVAIAREVMPGRVGVTIDGFAGRLLD